jgi:hypothetical protein
MQTSFGKNAEFNSTTLKFDESQEKLSGDSKIASRTNSWQANDECETIFTGVL